MDHSWVDITDLWEGNNAHIQEKRRLAAESLFKSVEPPGAEETQALEDVKRGSLHHLSYPGEFRPKHDGSGAVQMPTFDPESILFYKPETEMADAPRPRTCSNVHLYDFQPRDWEAELRGREYNFAEEEKHLRKYQWAEGAGSFPQLIQLFCIQARLRECRWPRCNAQRERLEKAMPTCEGWENFRQWALVTGSCQLAAAGAGYQWLEDFSALQIDNMAELKRNAELPGDPTLVFVCKITHFLLTQVQIPCSIVPNGYLSVRKSEPRSWGWYSGAIPQRVTIPAIQRAMDKAARLEICKHRLWNLAYGSEKGQDDLLSLMELAEECPTAESLKHAGHARCSAEFCLFDDVNSARKQQLHKCADRACRRLAFPLDELNDAVYQGRTTAWPTTDVGLGRISLSPSPTRVMAISHVWSDRTGVGVARPGDVNSCLFLYFKALADELGCDGIWWDSICVPPDREAKRQAISKMQGNYADAAHTLVHDEYLLQFDWADDGSPALALVLSPWFTRGWTALELSVSKSVKVVYRDPRDRSRHVIKDLDDDILASHHFEKLGHIVASTVIRRLRNDEPSISDLLMVMRTRVTSWSRDRITIAALLARVPDYDYEDSPAASTIKIMQLYLEVPQKFLLHGHETASPFGGGFSWCPSNLLDSSPATVYDLPSETLHTGHALIDKSGAAISVWNYRLLTAEDKARLRPYALHMSVGFRIRQVLEEKWQHCLLIHNQSTGIDQSPSLLVTTAGICWPDESHAFPTKISEPFIDSHYIGCVFDNHVDVLKGKYMPTVGVRIGCDAGKPTLPAAEVLAHVDRWGCSRILSIARRAFRVGDESRQDDPTDRRRRGTRFDRGIVRCYGGIGGVGSLKEEEDDSSKLDQLLAMRLSRSYGDDEAIGWEELTGFTGPRGFVP